jgi:hypothetical protein
MHRCRLANQRDRTSKSSHAAAIDPFSRRVVEGSMSAATMAQLFTHGVAAVLRVMRHLSLPTPALSPTAKVSHLLRVNL